MNNSKFIWISFLLGFLSCILGVAILIFLVNSQKEVFSKNTTVAGIDVSLLSPSEAKNKIKQSLGEEKDFTIELKSGENSIASSASQLNFKYEVDTTIDQLFSQHQANTTFKKPVALFKTLFGEKTHTLERSYNEESLKELITQFATAINQPGNDPFATLATSNTVSSLTIDPGVEGLEVNQSAVHTQIESTLQQKNDYENVNVDVELEKVHYTLTSEEQTQAEKEAELLVGQSLVLTNPEYKDIKITLIDTQLIDLLHFPEGVQEAPLATLLDEINQKIKRESKNAVFEYEKNEDGSYTIHEFIPHQDGLEINKDELATQITTVITNLRKGSDATTTDITEIDLPLQIVEPEVTLQDTNDLGINELVGFGDSEYDHSIPNRIWNVSLTAEKMNNILVAPGEEFRFNKTLGEVSRRTGYRSAYVISNGKTVLGDGGGVCQVSTTYFRAVLDAGLQVTLRKPHSYRVSYYELNQKLGIDATVYSGDVDFRFVNDTDSYILIRSSADSDDLYMKVEIYGTSDGRTTEIVDHKTWDLRSPPPPAYYPTTEIPAGTTKQIDWAVSGIKASFKHIIKDKDGEVISEKEYYSNYVPWSAKYLQGI